MTQQDEGEGMRLAGLRVVFDDAMMRDAWMVKDAEGRVLACGVFGLGERKEQDGHAAMMKVGANVWERLKTLPEG